MCTGNCAACPDVVYAVSMDESMRNLAKTVERSATDDSIDSSIAPAIFQNLQRTGIVDFEVKGADEVVSPEDIAKSLRMGAAKFLDAIEEKRNETTKGVSVLTEGCLGPLTMRAVKAGRTITVKVCNSPQVPEGRQLGIVEVTRSWD